MAKMNKHTFTYNSKLLKSANALLPAIQIAKLNKNTRTPQESIECASIVAVQLTERHGVSGVQLWIPMDS
jgi:hypothetical protein